MRNGEKHFPLHLGQQDVLCNQRRFKAAIAGTGGGKTAIGPIWMMQQIERVPGGMWLVVAPTYKIMARATAPMLVKTFAGTYYEGVFTESRGLYKLPDGGIIWLLSADNPGGLEGGQFDGAWIDEGGQLKLDSWVAIQGRLGQKESPALITTTPYKMNWLYHDFYKRYLQGDETYYVRQWSSIENPAYPKAEFNRAIGSMSSQRAAMRYRGEFVQLAGLVYPDIEACFCEPFDPPPGMRFGRIDFGWNHPFCALAATLYIDEETGADVLYVDFERYKRFTTLLELS